MSRKKFITARGRPVPEHGPKIDLKGGVRFGGTSCVFGELCSGAYNVFSEHFAFRFYGHMVRRLSPCTLFNLQYLSEPQSAWVHLDGFRQQVCRERRQRTMRQLQPDYTASHASLYWTIFPQLPSMPAVAARCNFDVDFTAAIRATITTASGGP